MGAGTGLYNLILVEKKKKKKKKEDYVRIMTQDVMFQWYL